MESERKRRMIYLMNIKACLYDYSLLTGAPVLRSQLIELDHVRNDARFESLYKSPVSRFCLPFEQRLSPEFTQYLNVLSDANNSSIYLWSRLSKYCGVLEIPSLSALNVSFTFDFNGGIFSAIASDFRDEIIFDLCLNEDDEEILAVEIKGEKWTKITHQWPLEESLTEL